MRKEGEHLSKAARSPWSFPSAASPGCLAVPNIQDIPNRGEAGLALRTKGHQGRQEVAAAPCPGCLA